MGTYCTVEDIADFLRIPIDANTVPNIIQVEKTIDRAEDRIDQRTGHAWREKTITEEVHDLPLLYTFGWGTPIFLQHRNIKTTIKDRLDPDKGDKLEIWQGANGVFEDETLQDQNYELERVYGKLYIRGFIFSILRKNRIRVTYRYGDAIVPSDIQDACIKLSCVDIIRSSFRMDPLPMGAQGIDPQRSAKMWKEDADKIIRDREEVFIIP